MFISVLYRTALWRVWFLAAIYLSKSVVKMHIKSIILEGFKSYAQRTEVNGFDPLFNAITGLNGGNKQAQDPRTPQCLSQRKTQPCSAHNQPFMGASDTRKIKAGNMLLPLKISLWWFKTLNQVWLEQKHFCLFRLLRPWNWHGAEKYFLHGNFYFLVGICILG